MDKGEVIKQLKVKTKSKKNRKRFAAKLLFQFRVLIGKSSGVRRLCETQVIQLISVNAKAALTEAKLRGSKKQFSYKNNEGNRVHFEFIGVEELLCLDPGCDSDEVWYEIIERVRPMERRAKLIPSEEKLNAIRNQE